MHYIFKMFALMVQVSLVVAMENTNPLDKNYYLFVDSIATSLTPAQKAIQVAKESPSLVLYGCKAYNTDLFKTILVVSTPTERASLVESIMRRYDGLNRNKDKLFSVLHRFPDIEANSANQKKICSYFACYPNKTRWSNFKNELSTFNENLSTNGRCSLSTNNSPINPDGLVLKSIYSLKNLMPAQYEPTPARISPQPQEWPKLILPKKNKETGLIYYSITD